MLPGKPLGSVAAFIFWR